MMRKLEIGVSRNLSLSGIVTIILGAMYVGAMAMAVFLILVQCTSREDLRYTFPPLLRVELRVLGLSWDFWAKSVSELQLEVEQILLDAPYWRRSFEMMWSSNGHDLQGPLRVTRMPHLRYEHT